MGLSITPKVHILMDHAIPQLIATRGFADMREDRIEKSHQDRMKNEARLIRLRNIKSKMGNQAKQQEIVNMKEIISIQHQVASNSRRKRSRIITLKEDHDKVKKEERISTRKRNSLILKSNPNQPQLNKPREIILPRDVNILPLRMSSSELMILFGPLTCTRRYLAKQSSAKIVRMVVHIKV